MKWKGTKRTHSETEKEHSRGERAREGKQGEDGMLGGVVASGGVLIDSEWHVVFSSAAIQPCAYHRLLPHPGIVPRLTP